MNPPDKTVLEKIHRFLDEAGDTTFFGKGRVPMLGQDGVSLSFGFHWWWTFTTRRNTKGAGTITHPTVR
jgi:hypothetical protein